MGEENGVGVIFGWQFIPSGPGTSVVLIAGTTLSGIEMVTVSDGLRTIVTFKGWVEWSAQGGGRRDGGVCCNWISYDPATLTVQ